MKPVIRSRDLVILAATALAVACGLSSPGAINIDGIGLDILVALRYAVIGSRHQQDESPVAIAWGRRKDVKVFGCSDDCARCGTAKVDRMPTNA